jgi:hypothetical protein
MDLLEHTQFYKKNIEYTRSNWREGSYFKSIIMTYYDSEHFNYGIFAKPELHFNIFICDWFVKGKEIQVYNYYYYEPNKHLITETPQTITRRYDVYQRIHLSEEPIIFTPDNIKCECGITHINNNKNLRIHINSKEHIAFCRK